jgi:hypothetical protein
MTNFPAEFGHKTTQSLFLLPQVDPQRIDVQCLPFPAVFRQFFSRIAIFNRKPPSRGPILAILVPLESSRQGEAKYTNNVIFAQRGTNFFI